MVSNLDSTTLCYTFANAFHTWGTSVMSVLFYPLEKSCMHTPYILISWEPYMESACL